jgi:GTP pyrophosphokinase
MREEFARLLKQLRKKAPNADLGVVREAYRVANEAHRGVERESGDPYISHCIEVALILGQLGLDPITIAAALVHDVLEDTRVTKEELQKLLGEEIAGLVDGVSKIKGMKWSTPAPSPQEKQAENLRKMLVATAKDVRVILIKLADRLHNMRTLEFLRDKERVKRICRETLDIYSPLAHRLGIARWKWELEDHAFHFLNPVEYKHIAAHVAMKRKEREAWLNETIRYLEERLAEAEVTAHVIGRPKHLYSIYQKMVQQGKSFDEVMDILAVRIITQTVAGCYNALGVVHHLWTPVPGRFKDYIAMPKINMYQSIHTVVMQENGIPLEIQIRTEEMDRTAREGIAAHWAYKEGRKDAKLDEQLKWLKQMYDWLKDAHAPDELLDSVRRDMARSDVYVFTPRGEVKELPEGATPLDFAYHIHSDIGHHCIGARVNGKLVPLRYNLQTGDVVEILTSRTQTPHLDWLDLVVTGKARTRIRQRLRELGELEPLEIQLRRDTVRVLPENKPKVQQVDDATREKLIRVDGTKGIAVQFAKCCRPMPGHAVIGYATKTPGITIHRADCRNFANTKRDSARIIEASWDGEDHVSVGMRVTTRQRPNMLADITNAVRPMNISITHATFIPRENGKSLFEFVFEAPDQGSVQRVAATLRNVPGVMEVQHMPASALAHAK